MPEPITAPGQLISAREEAILRAWLGGHRIADIAKGRREEPAYIGAVLDRLCGTDRGQAQTVLETGRRPATATQDAAPAPAEPDAVPTEPALVLVPQPAAPTSVAAEGVEELLAHAERLGGTVSVAATKIRARLEELRQLVERYAAEDAARQYVALKRRELDEAEARLRALTGRSAVRDHSHTPTSTAGIRAWAKSAGVDYNPTGSLRRDVIEKYHAAHPQAPR